MRHIIDLCDLTEKEFSDLYKLVSNIIDRPEGYEMPAAARCWAACFMNLLPVPTCRFPPR